MCCSRSSTRMNSSTRSAMNAYNIDTMHTTVYAYLFACYQNHSSTTIYAYAQQSSMYSTISKLEYARMHKCMHTMDNGWQQCYVCILLLAISMDTKYASYQSLVAQYDTLEYPYCRMHNIMRIIIYYELVVVCILLRVCILEQQYAVCYSQYAYQLVLAFAISKVVCILLE